jgi:hypothetical protein
MNLAVALMLAAGAAFLGVGSAFATGSVALIMRLGAVSFAAAAAIVLIVPA